MSKFIQVDNGVNQENRYLHSDNINTAIDVVNAFNQNIMDNPCSLIYDSTAKKVKLHNDFDDRPDLSKIISDNINKILDLKSEIGNCSLDILVPYLKFVYDYFDDYSSDIENLKLVYTDLSLSGAFDEIEVEFLKNKINNKLSELG